MNAVLQIGATCRQCGAPVVECYRYSEDAGIGLPAKLLREGQELFISRIIRRGWREDADGTWLCSDCQTEDGIMLDERGCDNEDVRYGSLSCSRTLTLSLECV